MKKGEGMHPSAVLLKQACKADFLTASTAMAAHEVVSFLLYY